MPYLRSRQRVLRHLSQTRLLTKAAIVALVSVIGLILGVTLLFTYVSKDLPNPEKVVRQEGFSSKIFDRNGKLLYDVFKNTRQTPVTLDKIPLSLRQATISIEDKNFYHHQGFDLVGIARSFLNLVIRMHISGGGSTLTQQLVKNALLDNRQTVTRKLKEFILAIEIENKFTKDQILTMYLNETPYGGTAVGVQEAAETYFGKNVTDLTLVEAAILAGLPQEPSVLSPFGPNPKAYIDRSQNVLRRMREDGYITSAQEKQVDSLLPNVQFAYQSGTIKAPHFVFYVEDILKKRYGENVLENGGLSITTSLDLDLQEKAQQVVADEIKKVIPVHITNGGAVVINPTTGEILAMVGSRAWDDPNYDGKVNVTLALRQPGSSIKPITYVTGLKNGYTASTLLMDVPTTFPGGVGLPDYKPVNYDGKFHGPLSVRTALASSINVTAVKMLALVGIRDMLSTAYDMGISTLAPTDDNLRRFGLSVTLGGGEVRLLELTSAYSAFANTGFRQDPIAILKVTDMNGRVLEEFHPSQGRRVLTSEQTFIMNNILSDNDARALTFSANSLLNIPNLKVAVKTGTTNDKRDNWTIGWTTNRIVGVWVGNNDNSAMQQVASGVSGASPIWRQILLASMVDQKKEDFPMAPDIVTAEVDNVSGYRSHDGFSSHTEFFIRGTEPSGDDPVHKLLKVCRSQGKLATPADIAHGVYDDREFFLFQEKDPTAGQKDVNRWQQGIDLWLKGQTDQKYHPPTDYCDTQGDLVITITSPQDHQQLDSNTVSVRATSQSVNDITKMEVLADGQSKATSDRDLINTAFDLPNGPHTISFKAWDNQNRSANVDYKIGVKVPWDITLPTPLPSATLTPSPTP